jgi:hypothetical protein
MHLWILLAVMIAVSAGCGGNESAPVVRGADESCLRAWNESAPADNRHAVAETQEQLRVVVSRWIISHPAEDLTGDGCSYFFFSDARWFSFSGAWQKDGDLRWDIPPTQRGPRRPEQQISEPNAEPQADGTLR